ncbi:hypothetical protein [Chryseobacterium sp. CH1]|nr:hypothetical protein [Chryseobacterium sp. CH1]
MEIHVIRHTAIENPESLCYGFAEMPLQKDHIEDFKTSWCRTTGL